MPIPTESFLKKFLKESGGKFPTVPEMQRGTGSLEQNARDLTMMNGTTDMMGMPSQGAQELAQRVNENEKTGVLQKFVDFLNRGPFPGNENDPRTPTGSKLIMGPDGQMYDENFIKTIPGGFNNMPEIQRRKKLFESLP
mgnify:CR=1 FL=1|jgi:hypothetical protein